MYVGETSRHLRHCNPQHRNSINRGDVTKPVAKHFKECSHPVFSSLFFGIEHIKIPVRRGDINLIRRHLRFFI